MRLMNRYVKHFLILLALFMQTVSAQSVANPKVTYFHNDITGTAVVATDEKGEVIWREQRRAYGEIKVDPLKARSLDEFSVGYTGHQADKESGLTYAKARYYNKTIGRFYAPDPIPFRESDLVSINRYAYAGNNPYKYVDPTGECYASIESGISCTSYELDQQNLAINAANQEFSDGRYLSGVAGYVIGAAQTANVAVGFVADMLIAPGNVTYNYTSGMMEGDYKRAQRAGVEGLAIAAGGKLGQMAVGTAAKVTTEASKNATEAVAKRGVLDGANYAQKTFGKNFSSAGKFAGQSVNDVAVALKSGNLKPSDVPIDYIVRNGNTLILNTRSSQALIRAGIPRSQWNAVNRTGDAAFEARLSGQLKRNKLTETGTPTVRQSGGQ